MNRTEPQFIAIGRRLTRGCSGLSDMVNDAVKLTLAEDAEGLEAIEPRKRGPNLDCEFVKALKRRGKL